MKTKVILWLITLHLLTLLVGCNELIVTDIISDEISFSSFDFSKANRVFIKDLHNGNTIETTEQDQVLEVVGFYSINLAWVSQV